MHVYGDGTWAMLAESFGSLVSIGKALLPLQVPMPALNDAYDSYLAQLLAIPVPPSLIADEGERDAADQGAVEAYRDQLCQLSFTIAMSLPTGNVKRSTISKRLGVLSDANAHKRFILQFDADVVYENDGGDGNDGSDKRGARGDQKSLTSENQQRWSLIRIAPTWRSLITASSAPDDSPGEETFSDTSMLPGTLSSVYV